MMQGLVPSSSGSAIDDDESDLEVDVEEDSLSIVEAEDLMQAES